MEFLRRDALLRQKFYIPYSGDAIRKFKFGFRIEDHVRFFTAKNTGLQYKEKHCSSFFVQNKFQAQVQDQSRGNFLRISTRRRDLKHAKTASSDESKCAVDRKTERKRHEAQKVRFDVNMPIHKTLEQGGTHTSSRTRPRGTKKIVEILLFAYFSMDSCPKWTRYAAMRRPKIKHSDWLK